MADRRTKPARPARKSSTAKRPRRQEPRERRTDPGVVGDASSVRTQPAPPDAPPTGGPRWRELVGDDLAARVAAVAGRDPAAWCRRVVENAVRQEERHRGDVAAQKRDRCAHPENRRTLNGRCGACGMRGLPGRG